MNDMGKKDGGLGAAKLDISLQARGLLKVSSEKIAGRLEGMAELHPGETRCKNCSDRCEPGQETMH